jgi:hypothetical protein
MKRIVKEYQVHALVSAPLDEGQTFSDNLASHIADFQEKGMIVEIQYQQSETRFSALVLGFKNVQVEVNNDTIL